MTDVYIEYSKNMSEQNNFIKTGDARVEYELLSIIELARLAGDDDNECSQDVLIKTLNKMLFGIPLYNTIVLEVAGCLQKVIEGISVLRVMKMLLNTDAAFYDAANGFFVNSPNKMSIKARKLINPIGDVSLNASITKFCPDESQEYVQAVVRNLNNCNTMLSSFRHPVCFIRCDENVAKRFEFLFE